MTVINLILIYSVFAFMFEILQENDFVTYISNGSYAEVAFGPTMRVVSRGHQVFYCRAFRFVCSLFNDDSSVIQIIQRRMKGR
jgi:hypothetical protein